ncbi:MAG: Dabb family protein [Bacteroidales bacterium]|nr:Dabb family protein [Bacteroidales bacterium]
MSKVKHIILWKLRDDICESDIAGIKRDIKVSLEDLKGEIPGLLEIHVVIDKLPSSNMDVMLDSLFESEEALRLYANHPAHVAVADGKVRPYTMSRNCIDYIVSD